MRLELFLDFNKIRCQKNIFLDTYVAADKKKLFLVPPPKNNYKIAKLLILKSCDIEYPDICPPYTDLYLINRKWIFFLYNKQEPFQ